MLEDEFAEHVNILLSQQKFLESLGSKERQNNLITGVAEKNTGDDVETVQCILKFIIPENTEHLESIGMVVEI